MFSANGSKKLVAVWAKYLSASERSYCVRTENSMVIGFGVTIREILRLKIPTKC